MATFGNTSVQSTRGGMNIVNLLANRFTLTEAGDVTKLSLYQKGTGSAAACKGLIYASSAGAPAALLGTTNEATGWATDTWTDLTFATPVSLVAGDYFLTWVYNGGAGDIGFAYDTTGGVRYYRTNLVGGDYTSPPNPFGTPGGNDVQLISIYATYTPTAAPPVAAFSGTPLTITSGQTVTFTDASTNTPTSWLWEKNDGSGWVNFDGTPTAQNPTETFT